MITWSLPSSFPAEAAVGDTGGSFRASSPSVALQSLSEGGGGGCGALGPSPRPEPASWSRMGTSRVANVVRAPGRSTGSPSSLLPRVPCPSRKRTRLPQTGSRREPPSASRHCPRGVVTAVGGGTPVPGRSFSVSRGEMCVA